jgi:hypothetical protein
MSGQGNTKKLLLAGVLFGALFVVLRAVRGGETVEEDEIDRIDTGNERNEEPVETGLDRVESEPSWTEEEDVDADTGDVGADDADADSESDVDVDSEDRTDGLDSGEPGVLVAERRLDDLDLFDYVAILTAAFEAAKEEYEARL